ncbi:hypothetical protein [Alkalihalobacillus sp. TS-13]|nr:hypothetical protein [Alkalihalobacillus sp. TS-13]
MINEVDRGKLLQSAFFALVVFKSFVASLKYEILKINLKNPE